MAEDGPDPAELGLTPKDLGIEDQTARALKKARETGRVGNLLFEEEKKGGRSTFYLKDPQRPEIRVRWDPFSSSPPEFYQRFEPADEINPALPMADKIQKLSADLWLGENTMGGIDDIAQQELAMMINRATLGSPAENKTLGEYGAARIGLDSLYRSWFKSFWSEEDKPKFLRLKDDFVKEKTKALAGMDNLRTGHLIAGQGMFPLTLGPQAGLSGIGVAIEMIKQTPTTIQNPATHRTERGGYFSKGVKEAYSATTGISRDEEIKTHLQNQGLSPTEAQIALTLAERLMQVSLESELYGGKALVGSERIMPSKAADEGKKATTEGATGLLTRIFGLKK
ncbi:hypothetical protein HY386_01500 [Candidatus Daviesbacteria bacterium]|nr:hypothetical protein [Candidatus Daviesbacteria bacterium]